MKKTLIFCMTLLLAAPLTAISQTGRVFDDLSMESNILGGERKYALYLPPCYETSHRSYPVLYLLHGAGDDQSGWIQFGEVMHIADKAIMEGKATPMIIVMPDANTGHRGYFNHINGEWRYEDFFFQELMPYVENKYRIRKEKRYRAISGLSMGGGGTFMYALRRPDLFSSAAPLSAYVGPLTFEEARNIRFAGDPKAVSEKELRQYWERHNAISLINNWSAENKRSVRWYIDCGDDDFLYEGNSLVHIAMKKNDIPHEFRIREGGHTWTYWRESLPKVLEFVSQAFHQY
jgi:enterochelin esterase-like enzyme